MSKLIETLEQWLADAEQLDGLCSKLLGMGFWLPVWVLVGVSNSLHNSSVDRKLNRLAKES